jgi:hypothetical protein
MLGGVRVLLFWKAKPTQPPAGTVSDPAPWLAYFQVPEVPSDQNKPQ